MRTDDTETASHEAETETIAVPVATPAMATLETVHPRLANAVDRWWGGNMVGGEEWQQRQSYAQREDLKNFLTRILEGA